MGGNYWKLYYLLLCFWSVIYCFVTVLLFWKSKSVQPIREQECCTGFWWVETSRLTNSAWDSRRFEGRWTVWTWALRGDKREVTQSFLINMSHASDPVHGLMLWDCCFVHFLKYELCLKGDRCCNLLLDHRSFHLPYYLFSAWSELHDSVLHPPPPILWSSLFSLKIKQFGKAWVIAWRVCFMDFMSERFQIVSRAQQTETLKMITLNIMCVGKTPPLTNHPFIWQHQGCGVEDKSLWVVIGLLFPTLFYSIDYSTSFLFFFFYSSLLFSATHGFYFKYEFEIKVFVMFRSINVMSVWRSYGR